MPKRRPKSVFCPEQVKKRRKKKKLTQAELAEKTGLSEYTIRFIETGRRVPGGVTLGLLADALEVSVKVFYVATL